MSTVRAETSRLEVIAIHRMELVGRVNKGEELNTTAANANMGDVANNIQTQSTVQKRVPSCTLSGRHELFTLKLTALTLQPLSYGSMRGARVRYAPAHGRSVCTPPFVERRMEERPSNPAH